MKLQDADGMVDSDDAGPWRKTRKTLTGLQTVPEVILNNADWPLVRVVSNGCQ